MITQYQNAKIYQIDGSFTKKLSIENGKVVDEKLPPQKIISLPGKYIFPTFEDAHNHPSGMCHSENQFDLEPIPSLTALKLFLQEKVPHYSFLMGLRWNTLKGEFDETFLNDISSEIPIVIVEISYHKAYLNTAAQDFFQVPQNFPGNLGKGVLEEQAWIEFSWPKLQTTAKLFQESLLDFQKMLLSQGIGAVHDLFLGNISHLEGYQTLIQQKKWLLPLEGYLSPHLLPTCNLKQFPFIKGLKLLMDGSFGAHSACLKSPYQDSDKHVGSLWWPLAELQRRIRLGIEHGLYQFALHLIGDKTVEQAIELITWARKEYGNELFFRLEHLSLIQPEQLAQLRDLEVAFCLQPNFIPMDQAYEDRLGKRILELVPLSLYKELNQNRVGFGSDHLPTNPWFGIQAAVKAPSPQQRISLTQAIKFYTQGSASLAFQEKNRGELSIGKEANFWISSSNPLETEIKIEQVFLKGRCVYQE